jgi:glutathione-S-conjugate glycine hydrolase
VVARACCLLLLSLGALIAVPARAQHAALPDSLISLDSAEGERLLAESSARRDFVPLVEQYVTQENPGYCGIASAVMVLNALQIPASKDNAWGAPFFTQKNLFNEKARSVAQPGFQGGLTLQQLADILQSHPATAEVHYASDTTLEAFRGLASTNMGNPRDFIIVNYNRAEVGQEYMGHISPIAAYHAASDRFLLLDVARYKYPPVWIPTDQLFRAMRTSDPVAGKSRGFLVVTGAPGAPGPSGIKARSPFRILIGIVVASFLLGAVVGAGVQTLRYRRKLRRAD